MGPSVTGSLDPLSSPSPSLSPPPDLMDESELSELTDADEDSTLDAHSSVRRDSDVDGDGDRRPRPRLRFPRRGATVGTKPRSRNSRKLSTGGSSSRRKKRGGIVPAPMWDWAYKNGSAAPGGTSASTSTPLSGPGPGPGPATTSHSLSGIGLQRHNHTAATHVPMSRYPKSSSTTPEEEEEEELPAPPRAMEEEEGEDGDLDRDLNEDDGEIEDEDEGNAGPSSRPRRGPSPVSHRSTPNTSRTRKLRLFKNEMMAGDEVEIGGDEDVEYMDILNDHGEDSTTEEYPDHATGHWGPSPDQGLQADKHEDSRDAVPSVPPSGLGSPDHTPDDEDGEQEVGCMGDVADEQDGDMEGVDDEDPSPTDHDVDTDHPTRTLGDGDEHMALVDDRESNIDEAEPEAEEPDDDPDLQPAHRAEALDVLAAIELKFAMLRERVYIEKMEGLAWEEGLIWDGIHPELHYLLDELTKRRDKRLTLAERKRAYEMEALERRRKDEESWVWDIWEHARNELQTEMMAETNRKRRKLERERRAMERPPGSRRIPMPMLNPPSALTLREIANTTPLPSYLAHLVPNTSNRVRAPLRSTLSTALELGSNGLGPNATAYPDLPTLAAGDIATDLEYIFQHRRAGFGFAYGMDMAFPAVSAVGFPDTGPGITLGMGLGPGAGGSGFTGGLGMNGLGPADVYHQNAVHLGVGTVPSPAPGLPVPPQSHGGMTGPDIGSIDPPGFAQPPMSGLHLRDNAHPPGPDGVRMGMNGTIIPGRPQPLPESLMDHEREGQAQRELLHDHDHDFSQREREIRNREEECLGEIPAREREREREFTPNIDAGFHSSRWCSNRAGRIDWPLGERRPDEETLEREKERERDKERQREMGMARESAEHGERARSQPQPIVAPAALHHQHQHPHRHVVPQHRHISMHGQRDPSHLNHSARAQPYHQAFPQQGSTATRHHHHHKHHHHILHHHHSSGSESQMASASSGVKGLGQDRQPSTTMEIINLSANPSLEPSWKKEHDKFGNASIPNSRPSSTHPPYDERERERERDRPVATQFVLGPSHHSISATSSPRHGFHGEINGPSVQGGPGVQFPPPPERFHSPIPGGPAASHRFPNLPPSYESPSPHTTSPSRTNARPPSGCSRKSPPLLPPPSKLGMPPLVFSPRLAGPGVLPTGPGVPGVLSGIPPHGSGMSPGMPSVAMGDGIGLEHNRPRRQG